MRPTRNTRVLSLRDSQFAKAIKILEAYRERFKFITVEIYPGSVQGLVDFISSGLLPRPDGDNWIFTTGGIAIQYHTLSGLTAHTARVTPTGAVLLNLVSLEERERLEQEEIIRPLIVGWKQVERELQERAHLLSA